MSAARSGEEEYKCRDMPCMHFVVDEERGIFKVFLEDRDIIIPVSLEKMREVCYKLQESVSSGRLKEADEEETDYLAKKYLGAEPLGE